MIKITVFLFYTFLFTSVAEAAVFIDTGTPIGSNSLTVCRPSSFADNCYLSVALKVRFEQDFVINDVKSYFRASSPSTDLTVALYNNITNSNVLNYPGQELYRTELSVTELDFRWNGVNGLNWGLNAGDYWVAFEVREGQSFFGTFPTGLSTTLEGAIITPYTLDKVWLYLGNNNFTSIGLVLEGTPMIMVPEPESFALLLFGLSFISIATRRHISIK